MIAIGTMVEWKSKQAVIRGVVKDFYKFKSKEWADKYNCAYLIERPNEKYVLKFDTDVHAPTA